MDYISRDVMYHLKPVLQPDTQFQNSTCMYKLKNLMMNAAPTTSNSQTICSDASVENEKDILDRQEKLLANLRRLQENVSTFAKKLEDLRSTHTVPQVNCFDSFDKAEIRDFVINADPSHPPYALLWLPKLWDIRLNITIHKHSSVPSIPENLNVFDRLKSDSVSSDSIRTTLVWKRMDENVQLIVSPIRYKTVAGEVNVLRFFDYVLNGGENVLKQIRKNEVLDLVHRLDHVSSKDQPNIVTQLQKHLGNETWMCGPTPTMIDAAVWSALLRLKKNILPAALNKYVSSCSEFVGVSISS